MLFRSGDAFSRYAKTGASANAFTSFDMTCYLFSCTENFYDSLKILLDFVQSPYFTEETVQKEQGIIGQEIRMYDDDPQWRVLFNMLGAMYKKHPVKIDIAGTTESIAEITPEYLYRCYHTFYNLNNMALCIAGDFDVEKVLDIVNEMLKPSEAVTIDRVFEEEPDSVEKNRVEQHLSVATPIFQFGFKESVATERVSVQKAAETEILLEIMASDASPLFRKLLDAGLINEASFGSEYFEGAGYASVIFSGESKDPDAVAKEIIKECERLKEVGIDVEAFKRSQKSVYGRNVAALNSVENIANSIISLEFSGRELFEYINAISSVTIQSVQRRLSEQFCSERSVLSIVSPIK